MPCLLVLRLCCCQSAKEIARYHALSNDDPEFAELLDCYETLSRDITACKLIGQLDDKTWEKKRYEELELQHKLMRS